METSESYPRFRWFVLIMVCVVNAASMVVTIGPAPFIGVIAKEFGVSAGLATGTIMGLFNLVAAISCFAGGAICDRFGVVKAYLASLLLLSVPFLFLPIAGRSFAAVVILRLVQGLGVGCIASSVSLVAAVWFPPEQRGIVTGFQGMSVTAGSAIGFTAAPAAFAAVGSWRLAMAWLTASCLIGLVFTVVVPFGSKPPVAPCLPEEFEDGAFSQACRLPETWLVVAIMFCLSWVYCAFNDLTPGYLAIEAPVGVGYGPMLGGKLMMLVQVAAMVGSVVTGYVFEKVFKGRAGPVMVIGYLLFAVAAVFMMSPGVYTRQPVMIACLLAAGFFQAWVIPNALAFYSLHYPAHIAGRLVGMAFGIALFGGTTGIIMGALALHHTGHYHASILMVGAVALVGLALSAVLRAPNAVFCGEVSVVSESAE